MMDSVAVFEVHFSNINRYVTPFVNSLIEKGVAKNYYVIYPGFVDADKIEKPSNSKIEFLNVNDYFKLESQNLRPQRLFFNYSYRLADLYWTYKFKKLGFFCFQQQHGMYADFLKRSFLGYFSTIKRKLYYFKYLAFFGMRLKGTIFLYLLNKDFIKSKRINSRIKAQKSKLSPVQSDHVLIWGEFWKDWFIENQFYNPEDEFTVIGNPDYHKFIINNQLPFKEDEVCYIAQTFVEDGRMESNDYRQIIGSLAKALGGRLTVKLHPRSQKELYGAVIDNGGSLTYEFPVSGTYIGHYSSMLALALNMNAKVFLLEVNNEEIPHYFKETCDAVFFEIRSLIDTITNQNNISSKKEISYYFENKSEHPYELIARAISKKFNNGNL